MEPESGWMEPMIMRRSVLLPQPLPPMMTMVWPGCTSKVTPERTVRPSKDLTTLLSEMTGGVSVMVNLYVTIGYLRA